jgi:hypothetical protein
MAYYRIPDDTQQQNELHVSLLQQAYAIDQAGQKDVTVFSHRSNLQACRHAAGCGCDIPPHQDYFVLATGPNAQAVELADQIGRSAKKLQTQLVNLARNTAKTPEEEVQNQRIMMPLLRHLSQITDTVPFITKQVVGQLQSPDKADNLAPIEVSSSRP